MSGYAYIAGTVLLTVYGQLVVKWQVMNAGALPASLSGKLHFLGSLVINPWMLSVFAAAFLAGMAWMSALTTVDLSRAYPYLGVSFVLVLMLSGVFFDEPVSMATLIGGGLIAVGIAVGSQT